MKNVALALAAVALTLSACGGGGRPSVADIEKAIASEDNVFNAFTTDVGDDAVACMAEALHDSDLSDDALQAIVDGDEGYEGSSDDEKAIEGVTADLVACAT